MSHARGHRTVPEAGEVAASSTHLGLNRQRSGAERWRWGDLTAGSGAALKSVRARAALLVRSISEGWDPCSFLKTLTALALNCCCHWRMLRATSCLVGKVVGCLGHPLPSRPRGPALSVWSYGQTQAPPPCRLSGSRSRSETCCPGDGVVAQRLTLSPGLRPSKAPRCQGCGGRSAALRSALWGTTIRIPARAGRSAHPARFFAPRMPRTVPSTRPAPSSCSAPAAPAPRPPSPLWPPSTASSCSSSSSSSSSSRHRWPWPRYASCPPRRWHRHFSSPCSSLRAGLAAGASALWC